MTRWPALLVAAAWLGCKPSDEPATGGSEDLPEPALTVDVLVIGSGSSGLAAGMAASEAGADVLIIEMEPEPGGSAWYAGSFFAAGTEWQAELGIVDSIEAALDEWASFTQGGDPEDPMVQAFVRGAPETLAWVAETSGAEVKAVSSAKDVGSADRSHWIDSVDVAQGWTDALSDIIHTSTRADALVQDADGRVIGAWYTDMGSGETGWISAGATVAATGGYARNLERLLADRPALGGATILPEASYVSRGDGHGLIESVGAGGVVHNAGNYGFYVHGTADYREGLEGEALWMRDLLYSLVVDGEGVRVANEDDTRSLSMIDHLVDTPDLRLYAIFDERTFNDMLITMPGYNWSELDVDEHLTSAELLDNDTAWHFSGVEDLALGIGADPDTLAATIDRYVGMLARGEDVDFGKPIDAIRAFEGDEFYLVALYAGASKAYTGFETDENTRIIDTTGQAIEGLYGAGELIGMLGTDAIGRGFSGTATACAYTGRVAGRQASAFAAAR